MNLHEIHCVHAQGEQALLQGPADRVRGVVAEPLGMGSYLGAKMQSWRRTPQPRENRAEPLLRVAIKGRAVDVVNAKFDRAFDRRLSGRLRDGAVEPAQAGAAERQRRDLEPCASEWAPLQCAGRWCGLLRSKTALQCLRISHSSLLLLVNACSHR